MDKNLHLFGRILFAAPMALFALGHFTKANAMAGYVPKYFPMPIFWVYFTGVALILAAVSIVLNKMTRLSGMLLCAMLIIFALTLHLNAFQNGDPSGFLKDVALAGGALLISATGKKK